MKRPKGESVATRTLKQKIIEHLKEVPIAKYAYQKAGVPKATYYKWRETDDEFRYESDSALVSGRLTINDIARSQLIKQIHEGKLTALIFWLKHNDPDFNPRLTLEIQDKSMKATAEQIAELTQAMKRAGLVGVTLAHQEMAKKFREIKALESESDTDAEMSPPPRKEARKRRGVNIADMAKRLEEKRKF